jgi:tight adherence protein B
VTVAVALLCAASLAWWVRSRRDARARRDLDRSLPVLASDLARSVRSGATLRTALGDAAVSASPGVRHALVRVVHASDRGVPIDEALEAWRRDRSSPGVDLLVGACRFGNEHGGDLALALDAVSAALLDAVELADETAALTAQARASAVLLVALPPVGAGLFAVVDRSVAQVLLGTPAGWACLAVGTALDLVGGVVSVGMVRRAAR